MILNELSVVIPTLGGKSINTVIDKINDGIDKPNEILICIPKSNNNKLDISNHKNIKIINTTKGQVLQRIEGFKKAQNKFVLQLDDDCKILNNDIKNLLFELKKLGEGNAIAPIYYDEKTDKCSHPFITGLKGFAKSLIATIICGAPWGLRRMGCISKIGTNYGVDVNYMNSNLKETEWIPGGCVLHYNKSTIKENFFPFSGKAFCEDLMHSFLLRENSIKLWVCKNSSCKTEHAYFPNQKKEIIQYLEAFKYLQKLRNKRIARFWIWYFLNLLRIWIKFNVKNNENEFISIGIKINKISYTPEAYAYANYFKNKGFIVDLNYKEKLKKNNDIVINFMGFRPFWVNFINKNTLEIHEYTSLSTKPLPKIKDKIKYFFNSKPAGRIFMSKYIKESFNFKDNVPFIFREMGADPEMYKKNNNEKEFDIVYCGSVLYREGLIDIIENLAKLNLKILIIGFYDNKTFDRFQKYQNIKMLGRIERYQIPEYYSKCKVGLNFTPNIHPLNLQSSTKTIEYCAAGLGVISSKYKWINDFAKDRKANFLWIDEIKSKSDFEKFNFISPNVDDLSWPNILDNCNLDKFILKVMNRL